MKTRKFDGKIHIFSKNVKKFSKNSLYAQKSHMGGAENTKRYRGYCRPQSIEAPPEARRENEDSTPCILDTKGVPFYLDASLQ
jgi:hypothetical protein